MARRGDWEGESPGHLKRLTSVSLVQGLDLLKGPASVFLFATGLPLPRSLKGSWWDGGWGTSSRKLISPWSPAAENHAQGAPRFTAPRGEQGCRSRKENRMPSCVSAPD